MKRLNIFMGAAALAAVFMTASINMNAQEDGNRDEFGNVVRGPYETNRFGDNWFIGAGGGINVFLNEGYDAKIAPSVDAFVGKWITPTFGLRAGYQGLNSQVWSDNPSVFGYTRDADQGQYLQKFGYMYIHGDVLWNMSNAIGGYKETRFWDLIPYMHAGYYRAYGVDDVDYADNELAVGAGLLHNLQLSERLDLVIDMRATVVNGRAHMGSGAAVIPTVTAGFAFDLGWPGFVRTSTVMAALEAANAEKIGILEAAIVALEAANASLEADNISLARKNSDLTKKVNSMKNAPAEEVAVLEKMSPITVFFEIGKAVLNDKELKHLDYYAKNILEGVEDDTKIHITLMGSADSNTGTPARNKQLSQARGQYVFDILKNQYGISADRLVVESEVVKAVSKPELNRTVIISF